KVDPRRRLDRRLRHEPVDGRGCDRYGDRAEDEQPAPGEIVDDQTRQDDSEAAADAEDGRDQTDPDADLLPRELVADDPEAQGKYRRPEPLESAEEDQRPDVPRRRGAGAADEEERERDDEEPLLAVLVAELAEDGGRDRGDEEQRRQHPGHPGRRRVQVA